MKRQLLAATLLLAAAFPFIAAGAAIAGPGGRDEVAAREAPRSGGQVPLSRVLKELAQHHPGKQLNTTMGQAGGRQVYLVQWQLSNGRIVVFTVDAQTGQVVGQ